MSLKSFGIVFLCLVYPSLNSGKISNNSIQNAIENIRQRRFGAAEDILLKLDHTTAIPEIVKNVYNNSEKNTEVLLSFSSATRKIILSLQILTSLRNEMKTNNHQDAYRLMALYYNFQREVCNQSYHENCVRARPIMNEILLEIDNSAVEIFKSYIVQNNLTTNSEVMDLSDAVYNFYPSNTELLMQRLINETYSLVTAVHLADSIINGFSRPQQIISGLQTLFDKLAAKKDMDSPAVLKIANYMINFRLSDDYTNISRSYRHWINLLIEKLPTCVRNWGLRNEVCILNKGVGEYLVASDTLFYSKSYRAVYTADIDHIGDNGTWTIRFKTKKDDGIYISNQAHRSELLFDVPLTSSNGSRVVGLASMADDDLSDNGTLWGLTLIGDYCYIKNKLYNEFLYASDTFEGGKYRKVLSLKESPKEKLEHFQWQIQNCD